MITLTTLKMHNSKGDWVDWDVSLVEESDEGGNKHQFIKATYQDEVKRFSPNATDEDLLKLAENE